MSRYGRLRLKQSQQPEEGAFRDRQILDFEVRTNGSPGKILTLDLRVTYDPRLGDKDRRCWAELDLGDDCRGATPEEALLRLAEWMEKGAVGIRLALAGEVQRVPVDASGREEEKDEGGEE